jgi:ankyrin repeat protein
LQILLERPEGKALLVEADHENFLPIHRAAEKGHTKVAKTLIEAGSPVDNGTDTMTRPVHLAAMNDHATAVELFIKFDRNLIMITDTNGATPLHLACLNNSPSAAAKLIKLGASLEMKNEDGYTPLMTATIWHSTQCVEVLLKVSQFKSKKSRPHL